MQKDVVAGACIALIALLAPLGQVLVEGTVGQTNRPRSYQISEELKLDISAELPAPQPLLNDLPSFEVTGDPAHADEIADPPEAVQIAARMTEDTQARDAQMARDLDHELSRYRSPQNDVPPPVTHSLEDDLANARCAVTLLKPAPHRVRPIDGILGRSTSTGIPVVLIRPETSLYGWQVQETSRQGEYFRAVASFGSEATAEGSRFVVLVAYATCEEEVPQPGEELMTLPATWRISQATEVTLSRN